MLRTALARRGALPFALATLVAAALALTPLAAHAESSLSGLADGTALSEAVPFGASQDEAGIGEPATDSGIATVADAAEPATFKYPVPGTLRFDFAWQVLELVNEERAKVGAAPLTMDADLLNAAVVRSAEICVDFSHTRPNGLDCFSASSLMFGENIAQSQPTPAAVVESWMNSQGHRENMLDASYTTIGIGCFQDVDGTFHWVQCFGTGEATAVSQPANETLTVGVDVEPDRYGIVVEVVPTTLDGTTLMNFEGTVELGATQRFALAAYFPSGGILGISDNLITWAVADESVATVDASGIVTFKKSGAFTLTATTTGGLTRSGSSDVEVLPQGVSQVYRLYNPNSGLHHYTTSTVERDSLVTAGWNYENVSFRVSSSQGTPVYREYNPNDGNHNWTQSAYEHETLVSLGWKDEGVAWYQSSEATAPVYRLYNPNSGEHVYTMSKDEYDSVCAVGWQGEGVAWYSL